MNNISELKNLRTYFDSQVENSYGTTKEQFNEKLNELSKILQGHKGSDFSEKETAVLQQIYIDFKILSKGSANESLKELKRKVKNLLEKEEFIDTFSIAKTTPINKLKSWASTKRASLTNSLLEMIGYQFYAPFNDKKEYEKNKQMISELENKIRECQHKINFFFSKKSVEEISQEKKALEDELSHLRTQLEEVQKSNQDLEAKAKKAEKTRKDYKSLGGERVSIKTEDNVKLDGCFISAKNFTEKLVSAGGKLFTIDRAVLKNEDFPLETGLVFNKNDLQTSGKEVFAALKSLHLFTSPREKGSGFIQLQLTGTDKVAIISEKDKDELVKQRKINYSKLLGYHTSTEFPLKAIQTSPLKILKENKRGTIILGASALVVYEAEKREALVCLMQGLNVMMFNYRGYGMSKGEPSTEGLYKDTEAVYQYLKQVHGVKDQQIIAKGQCLSGGPMANLAGKHPIHLFLDQTYSEFSNIVQGLVDKSMKKFLQVTEKAEKNASEEGVYFLFQFLRTLIAPALSLFSPGYNTLEGLSKIEGKVLILESREDEITPRVEVENMLLELSKQGKLPHVKVASIPGKHASNWFDAKESSPDERQSYTGRTQVDRFLDSIGLLHPIIPRKKVKPPKTT